MSAHTPGPLKVVNGGLSQLAIVAKDGNAVAFVPRGHPDSEANAHLFAAAPDLRDAVEAALDEFAIGSFNAARRQRVVEFIRAAIARAEGR